MYFYINCTVANNIPPIRLHGSKENSAMIPETLLYESDMENQIGVAAL